MIYQFSNDGKRVYLSLNQPPGKPSKYNEEEWMEILKSKAARIRQEKGFEIPNGFELKTLSLESQAVWYKRSEVANICAKCYNLDNLPSDEELLNDYLNVIKFYETFLYENKELSYNDIEAGRAHIVRDICYIISNNENLNEEELFTNLRLNVIEDKYWVAYYQKSNENTSPKYSLNSARTLDLIHKDELKLTKLGEELVGNITPKEIFTHQYSLEIKKFFFKLALTYDNIKAAMEILKEEKRLRFYNPTCKLTNKVMKYYNWDVGKYSCKENFDENCVNCDHDLESHIKESSLPFEVLKKTGKWRGNVFWMTSRVTPMHLT